MKIKRFSFLICSLIIFLMSLSTFCIASQPTSVYLHETISVGTSSPSVGTTTLNSPLWDIARSVEFLYTYLGAGTLFYRYDGGTVTTANGHSLDSSSNIISNKIEEARNIQFLCNTSIGTITATYMRTMP